MTVTILVVDDDQAILEGVRTLLIQAGYQTNGASTGKEALGLLDPTPQLVILDIMLPDVTGHSLCRHIRELPVYIPILMLSAHDEVMDKVLGLELGADEYVTKPFEPRELVARVRAMLRFAEQQQLKLKPAAEELPVTFGPLKLWRERHYLELDGQALDLTPTEWALLELFTTHPGQVFGRETLLRHIWNSEFAGDSRTVDTHVQRLRAKLEKNSVSPRFIQTVRGFGYRFFYNEAKTETRIDLAL
jgi:DNA-binding response OmpR family regulator